MQQSVKLLIYYVDTLWQTSGLESGWFSVSAFSPMCSGRCVVKLFMIAVILQQLWSFVGHQDFNHLVDLYTLTLKLHMPNINFCLTDFPGCTSVLIYKDLYHNHLADVSVILLLLAYFIVLWLFYSVLFSVGKTGVQNSWKRLCIFWPLLLHHYCLRLVLSTYSNPLMYSFPFFVCP